MKGMLSWLRVASRSGAACMLWLSDREETKHKALAGLRSEGASITRCCSCALAASPGVQLCILHMGLDFMLSLPAMCRCSRATPFPPPLAVRTRLLRLVEAH
eukprot:2735121-Amphidinium_carterae.1